METVTSNWELKNYDFVILNSLVRIMEKKVPREKNLRIEDFCSSGQKGWLLNNWYFHPPLPNLTDRYHFPLSKIINHCHVKPLFLPIIVQKPYLPWQTARTLVSTQLPGTLNFDSQSWGNLVSILYYPGTLFPQLAKSKTTVRSSRPIVTLPYRHRNNAWNLVWGSISFHLCCLRKDKDRLPLSLFQKLMEIIRCNVEQRKQSEKRICSFVNAFPERWKKNVQKRFS